MDTPKVSESEYRFCLILWEREPIECARLIRLCKEKPGWSKAATYTYSASFLKLGNDYTLLYTGDEYWLFEMRAIAQNGSYVRLIYELAPEE